MTHTSPFRLKLDDPPLEAAVDSVCRLTRDLGGRALIVGGSVRDALLNHAARDIDIEAYGVPAEDLLAGLEQQFKLDLVGRSFGVVKLSGLEIDVSIPRRESKAGRGHRGFQILSDPNMTVAEAATRRDFTINTIAFDPLTFEVIDHYHGRRDLELGILRHVSHQFAEDPLRVLRGMQFAARFDLEAAAETIELCRGIEPEGLPSERLLEEWRKLILKGVRISRGLAFLRDTGWVHYFPELAALIDCPQDPGWHPEGDVWNHTLHCLNAYAEERVGEAWEDLVVGFAVLCHDFGKPATTEFANGRYRSHGHEGRGEEPTRSFLARLTRQSDLAEQVVPLVRNHLSPVELYDSKSQAPAIRRLARRVGRIDRLVRVAKADQRGRPPRTVDTFPAGEWLIEKARDLEVEQCGPVPIVMGRHLIQLGLAPGPHFGPILDRCYEAQLDGVISDLVEGLNLAREEVKAYRRDMSEDGE